MLSVGQSSQYFCLSLFGCGGDKFQVGRNVLQKHGTSQGGEEHRVQLLAPHRIAPESDRMSENIVKMLLKLQQAQCHDHCPGQAVPCPPLSGADPFLNPQLPPRHSSMPFPRALSLSQRAELSAVRSCSCRGASLQPPLLWAEQTRGPQLLLICLPL